MNAQDMLALARCCAAMLLNDHPLEWEDVPHVDQETFERLQAMVTVIAATLIEQAGTRGRGLWEATL